jgi:microcystin-dependent protein
MTVSSTTVVSNLNADMVDGKHASDFAIPVGTIMMWAGSTAPTGWLLCNGAAVSRTTYSDLFAVISTTYGTGNGSTTFNVPDLQRRFPLGA